jgi:hypothetical protein
MLFVAFLYGRYGSREALSYALPLLPGFPEILLVSLLAFGAITFNYLLRLDYIALPTGGAVTLHFGA